MSNFLEASGWTVLPAGEHAIRAVAPMTLGLDGQHAAFFIAHPDDATFYLTDACETSMHASSYGIEIGLPRRSWGKGSGLATSSWSRSPVSTE